MFLYKWIIPLVTSTKGLPEKKPFSSKYSGNPAVTSFKGVASRDEGGRIPLLSSVFTSFKLLEKFSIFITFGLRWPSWFLLAFFSFLGAAAPWVSSVKIFQEEKNNWKSKKQH